MDEYTLITVGTHFIALGQNSHTWLPKIGHSLPNIRYKKYRTIAWLSPRGMSGYRMLPAVQNNQNIDKILLANKYSWHGINGYLSTENINIILDKANRIINGRSTGIINAIHGVHTFSEGVCHKTTHDSFVNLIRT